MNQSPMEVDCGDKSSGTTVSRRGLRKRKLLPHERVEVKSFEDGFLGSWHPGTVVRCGKQKRHVKYEYLLNDDESKALVDVVYVSPVLDGLVSSADCCNERGFIRPPPPPLEVRDLSFGVCVDVKYQDAWWEGVLVDHSNGKDQRTVLFPDLGDEMILETHQLRLTQDWDEATENWETRGKWVFLDLIEEYERESFVPVSVRQLWYDISASKNFENLKHWTCNVKDLWRDLVTEVVSYYVALTVLEVIPALNLPVDFLTETPEPRSTEPAGNIDCAPDSGHENVIGTDALDSGHENVIGTDALVSDSAMESGDAINLLDGDEECNDTIPLQEECDNDPLVEGAAPEQEVILRVESVSPAQEIMPHASEATPEASSSNKKRKRGRHMSTHWRPLILTEVESYPKVVDEYLQGYGSKTIRDLLKEKVRKHLAYLGWKIEWMKDRQGRLGRYRYIPPDAQDDKVFHNIVQALIHMKMETVQLQTDHNRMDPTNDTNLSHRLSDQSQNDQDVVVCPPNAETSHVNAEPEFCPEAVVKYCLNATGKHWVDRGKWKLKAKNHLLAEGWTFDYSTERRRRTLYKSPRNQCLRSLQGACRLYIKEKVPEWTSSGMIPLDVTAVNEESVGHDSNDLLQTLSQLLQKEPELQTASPARSTENRNHKRRGNSKVTKPKRRRKVSPVRILRSSKRVQELTAPGLLHQKPLNILSWLIDNKTLTPKCKVYCNKANNLTAIEGRITYEGIRCSCCLEIYDIGGFSNHVSGSSHSRPSTNIYLKDGRSIFDCMVQVMHDHMAREATKKPSINLCKGENDNICSVCQYGGELILCDKCPSAFHSTCLGMADIPDGDWFCPSCRCGICGQAKIEETEDECCLTCIQCEHKYHIECVKSGGKDESRNYMGNWLCGKECEQIHVGLQNLLGKPRVVGKVHGNNLTWTLMKFDNSKSGNSSKNGSVAERYCKLSVGLSVMHECFEPLNNPFSNRDIVDDVVFNTRSDLSRVNFAGFYTVILEENEEMISIATIRIFGQEVAELPLVGTRLQYRRLGMCRILMNELEKQLIQLGVKRLVLPAIPSVLHTWTNSFGFAKMTTFERSQFVENCFLDFQGTIMCQKLLIRSPSPESGLTRDTHSKPKDVGCSIECEKSSSASEVDQTEKNQETEKNGMDLGSTSGVEHVSTQPNMTKSGI